jgi:hypothetical protein
VNEKLHGIEISLTLLDDLIVMFCNTWDKAGRRSMGKRSLLFFLIVTAILLTGCVKETYDMSRLSANEYYSPTMALPTIDGNVTFQDLNNLQIIDTVDNFLNTEEKGSNNPLDPDNFDMIYLDIAVKNGFPLRVSLEMSLFNSDSQTITSTINASGFLEAAPVDNNGKVTHAVETKTTITFTKEFLKAISTSDKIIFLFTFNTPNNASNYVTIYTDYKIYFKAIVKFKPDLNLKKISFN